MYFQLTAAWQRRLTMALAATVGCLVLASSFGQAAKHMLGHGSLKGLVPLFYLDNECSVPTWYSSMALGLAALLLGMIAVANFSRRAPFRYHWATLTAIFVLLSMDEIAMFHELPIESLRTRWQADGLLYYAWVIPGAVFALAIGAAFTRFLVHLPRATCRGMLVAAAVFLGGSLGVEMLSGLEASQHGEQTWRYALVISLEECLEMSGIVIFIHTLLTHLRSLVSAVHVQWTWTPVPAP